MYKNEKQDYLVLPTYWLINDMRYIQVFIVFIAKKL